MLRKIVLSLLLSIFADTAMADASMLYIYPDGRGAMPIETEQITMEAESVSIVPAGDRINHNGSDMNVTCVFYLRNLTDQPLDVSIGFPFESFYGMRGFGERSDRWYDSVIEEMSGNEAMEIPADSMVPDWLQFRAFTLGEEYEVTYERGVVNIENRMVFWPLLACWNMHFQPGETVRLVNTYNTGWNHFSYNDYYTASLIYIVRSGALWAGRIGDAVISITVPEHYFSTNLDSICAWSDWNGSPHVDGNRVTWHFTDWKPLEDLSITSFGLWTSDMWIEQPHHYLFQALDENGDLSFDQEKLETVTELQQHLAECRIIMKSARFDFLLPMTTLRRDWSDVNLEMYCASPRDQAAYLLLLENLEDAVLGRQITDPALESLFWLTEWFLPEEVSPTIHQFRHYYYFDFNTSTAGYGNSPIITREEVRDIWMEGGGCDLPLVLSSCSENSDISQITDLSIEASSELAGQAGNNYSTDNLLDGNPETAWVDGVYGYGHGEVITVSTNRKLIAEGFTVKNGYCKPGGAWLENARIRKFFICLNDTPLMVVELEDTMDMQVIRFPRNLPFDEDDSLTFEILEIYPGSTYQDAAVSELSLIIEQ